MFPFFDKIAFTFTTLLSLVNNFFESVSLLLLQIPRLLAYIFAAAAYLPVFVAPFFYILISVSVIYLILGRKGDS